MSKKNIVYLILGLAFVIIFVFYFFARGVNISVFPEEISSEAELNIEQGLGFKFGRRLIFFPGEKTISINAPGYYEKTITFQLQGSSNIISATLYVRASVTLWPREAHKLDLGTTHLPALEPTK